MERFESEVWTVYDPETDGDFKSWMESNKPSEVSLSDDGINWIAVRSPSDNLDDDRDHPELLLQSWESLKSSSKPITVQSITEIAKKHNILVGKWMCFPRTGNVVNCLWEKIATVVSTGSLPPSISAKVSTRKSGNHVLLVYNNDFTNVEEVNELEKALRKLGIKCKLLYKPDVYTYVGIYAKNEWGLCPALYESVYNIMTRESLITKTLER